jgi:hypothetical protein
MQRTYMGLVGPRHDLVYVMTPPKPGQ